MVPHPPGPTEGESESMTGPPQPEPPISAWRILVPAGVAELVLLTALGWWPGAGGGGVRVALFASAFAAYALAARRVKDAQGGSVLIWVVAVALRLALLPLEPSLSADAYRYLWDGHVQTEGFSPLGRTPLDDDLVGVRTPWFGLIPDPGTPTPYPPLAQLLFFAVSLAGGAVLQLKLLWVGLDLATGWVLGRIAHHSGRSRRLTQLLYLWSPLLVVEVAWSAHLAPLVLFPLALVLLLARVPAASGVALGFTAMVTPAALAALPALARRGGWRFVAGCLGGIGILAAPYAMSVARGVTGALQLFHDARFLEGPLLLVESAVPGTTLPRLVALAIVLGVSVWAGTRRLRAETALLWVLGAALLLTPALRPWYALAILPFAALRVSRAWLLFTALVFLAYAVPVQGAAPSGVLPVWVHLAVWLPSLAMLAAEGHRAWTSPGAQPLSPES